MVAEVMVWWWRWCCGGGGGGGGVAVVARFASVWLNAFGQVIINHKYCELLVMRN